MRASCMRRSATSYSVPAVYEVGISTEFRAWHVMPGMEGPEGELHSHDYRLEAVVTSPELDAQGMVVDLDVLQAAVEKAAARVRDQNLDVIQPQEADTVTVEVFARWAHAEIASVIAVAPEATLAIRIWESPVAFGGYAAPVESSSA